MFRMASRSLCAILGTSNGPGAGRTPPQARAAAGVRITVGHDAPGDLAWLRPLALRRPADRFGPIADSPLTLTCGHLPTP